jgi:hypothetical protein
VNRKPQVRHKKKPWNCQGMRFPATRRNLV